MWMDEIIRNCLPFLGTFDLTEDDYPLLARRNPDAPQGYFCLLNLKIHVSRCDYFWLHTMHVTGHASFSLNLSRVHATDFVHCY